MYLELPYSPKNQILYVASVVGSSSFPEIIGAKGVGDFELLPLLPKQARGCRSRAKILCESNGTLVNG